MAEPWTHEQAVAYDERRRVCALACAGMSDPAAEIAALRAEVERLREALQPFARLDDCEAAEDWTAIVSVADCRRASAALRGA